MLTRSLPDTEEKPIVCLCGASFRKEDAPKSHANIAHQYGLTPLGAALKPMFKTDLQPQVQNEENDLDNANSHQYRADDITRSPSNDPTPKSKPPLSVTLQKAEPQAQSGRIDPDISQNIQYQVDETPFFRVISIETQSADNKLEADFADSVYIEWQIWSLQGHPT
ncbi:C2H2 type zinc finger domain protein [Penicillium majusculum]|nr:C2H2 type zinc finger domain protein [Penicillium majusculum]